MNTTPDSPTSIDWRPADLDAARSEAETTAKLILIDFYSPT